MSFLRTWGPLFGLLALQLLVGVVVALGHRLVTAFLDRRFPDNLPISAGTWVEEQIASRGLDLRVRAVPGDDFQGAYSPALRTILLSTTTYAKRDPSFWAVGAHELGHAIIDRRVPRLGLFLHLCRAYTGLVALAGGLLMVGNVLFAEPALAAAAHGVVLACLVLDALILLEETAATSIALGLLNAPAPPASGSRLLDRRLRGGQLGAAWFALVASLGTYAAALGARLILLWQWDVLRHIADRRHFVPAAPLGALGISAAVLLSLLVLAAAVLSARFALSRRLPPEMTGQTHADLQTAFAVIRGVPVLLLFLLVHRQGLGVAFQLACTLGLLAATVVIAALLRPFVKVGAVLLLLALLPLLYPFRALLARATKGEPLARQDAPWDGPRGAREAGAAEALAAALAAPWYLRLDGLITATAAVPMVVLYWVLR